MWHPLHSFRGLSLGSCDVLGQSFSKCHRWISGVLRPFLQGPQSPIQHPVNIKAPPDFPICADVCRDGIKTMENERQHLIAFFVTYSHRNKKIKNKANVSNDAVNINCIKSQSLGACIWMPVWQNGKYSGAPLYLGTLVCLQEKHLCDWRQVGSWTRPFFVQCQFYFKEWLTGKLRLFKLECVVRIFPRSKPVT